ncbi:hypothetical protein, partial [Stutzerimonas nitrititolerans]|uniref:hypothetical protein n=1 Tax=Stutzerimonas nitrititolerans TaxID=2482751 RepID=UPI00289B289D
RINGHTPELRKVSSADAYLPCPSRGDSRAGDTQGAVAGADHDAKDKSVGASSLANMTTRLAADRQQQ